MRHEPGRCAIRGAPQLWSDCSDEGNLPGTERVRLARKRRAGYPVCGADTPKESRIYIHFYHHARIGNRSEYRDVQCAECSPASTAPLSLARAVGDVMDGDSKSDGS